MTERGGTAFARDAAARYYDQRAAEYDEWYEGRGRFAALARARLVRGMVVVGDGPDLPFADGAFDRLLTGHFYGHLAVRERTAFLTESQRVAGELVVVDSALRPEVDAEQWQERVLNDGSRHRVYKRYLGGDQLAEEIGGQVLLDGAWFVAARVGPGLLSLTPAAK